MMTLSYAKGWADAFARLTPSVKTGYGFSANDDAKAMKNPNAKEREYLVGYWAGRAAEATAELSKLMKVRKAT